MNTTHDQIPTLVLDRTSPIDSELVLPKLPSEGHFGRIRLSVAYDLEKVIKMVCFLSHPRLVNLHPKAEYV